jgi:hypothetical protein
MSVGTDPAAAEAGQTCARARGAVRSLSQDSDSGVRTVTPSYLAAEESAKSVSRSVGTPTSRVITGGLPESRTDHPLGLESLGPPRRRNQAVTAIGQQATAMACHASDECSDSVLRTSLVRFQRCVGMRIEQMGGHQWKYAGNEVRCGSKFKFWEGKILAS